MGSDSCIENILFSYEVSNALTNIAVFRKGSVDIVISICFIGLSRREIIFYYNVDNYLTLYILSKFKILTMNKISKVK